MIPVDLANPVFEVAVSSSARRVTSRNRRSRAQFGPFRSDRPPCRVVVEPCGHRRVGRIGERRHASRRTLLIHGARSPLLAAERHRKNGHRLTRLHAWVLEQAQKEHQNRAVVALASKMARIVRAVWKHERAVDGDYLPQAA